MQSFGTLKKEQLIRFFSDEMPASRIEPLLNELINYNYLRYDADSDTYSYHAPPSPALQQNVLDRRIKSFWVLANYGSQNVLQTYILSYPLQCMFITPDNISYDVTVCTSESDAQIAAQVWRMSAIKNVPDITNHIAVVDDHELGKKLRVYGFDSYCIVDPETFDTQHYRLE